LNERKHVLIPLSFLEISEIINALREYVSVHTSAKVGLLGKLHYHLEWFPILQKVERDNK
jgi:hypothetical protein